MDITVPIPDYLYRGLTDDLPSWQTANRGDISRSPALQAFEAMIRQRSTKYSFLCKCLMKSLRVYLFYSRIK